MVMKEVEGGSGIGEGDRCWKTEDDEEKGGR